MKIETMLDQIDLDAMALPEFQRGYVWNRNQVRGLMHSLYRKHPVGSLLVWVTKTEHAKVRGDGKLPPGSVKLVLDGQQRITSLYGIIRGKPPKFFDGNPQAFMGLHFNLEDETFEFYAPAKMKGDPLWVNVTEVMEMGAGKAIERLFAVPSLQPKFPVFANRLNSIDTIKQVDLHIEEVAGEDKTVEVVVNIFNRVNSGGTKLSHGDLALAQICAQWPDARQEMKRRLDKWRRAGFYFRLELLLRVINAITTGETLFDALGKVSPQQFREGLDQAERCTDRLLNMIASRLGLDHDRVLGSRFALPLMARYLMQRGGRVDDHRERDRLLYWYVHTVLWGHYSGNTETTLTKDLSLIAGGTPEQRLTSLIEGLRQTRGDLRVTDKDFLGISKGSRFYPLLYMLTRAFHARDWGTGDEITNHLLGRLSTLEVHHIFPKKRLYEHKYKRREVNAIANFTFLTKETNLLVSKRDPAEYIPEFERRFPGVVASHWIPMDPNLWRIENYPDFLQARRELLTKAANEFLDGLLAGLVPEPKQEISVVDRVQTEMPGGAEGEDEEREIRKCNEWVIKHGLPAGELMHELVDPATGQRIAVLDLAWPNGLQEGLSQPVALLLDEGPEMEEIANEAGYRFFTSVKALRGYVRKEVLAEQVSVT